MIDVVAAERMRWKLARFCWEHVGDPDFENMCRTLRVPLVEARRLALEFAHG